MSDFDEQNTAATYDAPIEETAVASGPYANPADANPEEELPGLTVEATADEHGNPVESTERAGIVYTEQTDTHGIYQPPPVKLTSVCEPLWDMDKFFALPIRVASGSWSTTNLAGNILRQFALPYMWTSFDRWANVFKRYMYFRCKFRFRVELNGTNFHAGRLTLLYAPYKPTTIEAQSLSPDFQTLYPHLAMYPAYNTTAELEIPFMSSTEFMPVSLQAIEPAMINASTYAKVYLAVFAPLLAASGSSTAINYTIYCSLHDVELYVQNALTGSAQLFDTHNLTIGSIVDSTTPINVVGDEYDLSANISGMDLPIDSSAPMPMVMRAISANHVVRGNPATYRLSAIPESQIASSRYNFDVPYDEMSFSYLSSRWFPVNNQLYSLSTTNTFGSIIFSCPITPTAGSPRTNITPMNLLVNLFDWWRGDIDVCMEFYATQFHTAKLFAGVSYSAFGVEDFSVSGIDPTTYYGKIIEINKKKNCFEVNIPYQFGNSWCSTRYPDFLDQHYWYAYRGAMYGPPNGSTLWPYDQAVGAIGTFFICVLNPLVIPSNVSSSINFAVFWRGGKNFEVHTPFISALGMPYPVAQSDDKKSAPKKSAPAKEAPAAKKEDLAPKSAPAPVKSAPKAKVTAPPKEKAAEIKSEPIAKAKKEVKKVGTRECALATWSHSTLPERMKSLRDFCKRTYHFGDFMLFPITPTTGNPFAFRVIPIRQLLSYGFFGLLGSTYRALVGDVRVKIVSSFAPNASFSNVVRVYYIPPNGSNSSSDWLITAFGVVFRRPFTSMNDSSVITENLNTLSYAITPQIGNVFALGNSMNYQPSTIFPLTCEVMTLTKTELELEIPYNCPQRFVGAPHPLDTQGAITKSVDEEIDAWGALVLVQEAFTGSSQPNGAPPPLPPNAQPATISLYVSGGDNMRYAQYVYAATLSQPYTPVTINGFHYGPAPVTLLHGAVAAPNP